MAPCQRPLPGRAVAVEQRHLFGDLRGRVLLAQRDQQVLLAAEVPVYGPLGETGLGGDFVKRRAGEAAARIDLGRRVEQSRARLRPALGAVEVSTRHQSILPLGSACGFVELTLALYL